MPPRRKRQVPPSRPGVTPLWSEISDESFFDPGPIDPRALVEEDSGADSDAEVEAAGEAESAAPIATDPPSTDE